MDSTTFWFEVATAVGTVGAAAFAGWAALVATRAANASRELVELERRRDDAAEQATFWRQARRVTVDMGGMPIAGASGDIVGWDAFARVTNASADPIFKIRLKMTAGSNRWGPQLFGNLSPGEHVECIAHVVTPDPTEHLDCLVRFVDADGRGWVASATGDLSRDEDLQTWIDEGREFGAGGLTAHERGTASRSGQPAMPDLVEWRRDIDQREGPSTP